MEIVGLKNFVQDDVNKLIAKFVGVKPPKFIEELKFYIRNYDDHLWEQRQLLMDLGAEDDEDEDDEDENSLTFIELSLTAIKNGEWDYQEYLNEQTVDNM